MQLFRTILSFLRVLFLLKSKNYIWLLWSVTIVCASYAKSFEILEKNTGTKDWLKTPQNGPQSCFLKRLTVPKDGPKKAPQYFRTPRFCPPVVSILLPINNRYFLCNYNIFYATNRKGHLHRRRITAIACNHTKNISYSQRLPWLFPSNIRNY